MASTLRCLAKPPNRTAPTHVQTRFLGQLLCGPPHRHPQLHCLAGITNGRQAAAQSWHRVHRQRNSERPMARNPLDQRPGPGARSAQDAGRQGSDRRTPAVVETALGLRSQTRWERHPAAFSIADAAAL